MYSMAACQPWGAVSASAGRQVLEVLSMSLFGVSIHKGLLQALNNGLRLLITP